jgi:hypothetical protein
MPNVTENMPITLQREIKDHTLKTFLHGIAMREKIIMPQEYEFKIEEAL